MGWWDEKNDELDPTCELFRTGWSDEKKVPLLNKLWVPFGMSAIGVITVLAYNRFKYRPLSSSIHLHVLFGIGGYLFGTQLDDYRNKLFAERNLQYYHYMTLHPEDFRPPKKILFRDYLEPWHPIRS